MNARGGIRIWRVRILNLSSPLGLVRIDMGHRHPLDATILALEIDRTPIGHLRHDQLSDPSERLPKVERAGECVRRRGEQVRLLAAPPLCVVQLRGGNRGRHEVAERARRFDFHLAEVMRFPVIGHQRPGHA